MAETVKGRTIATTRLIAGKIAIGETVTVSTVTDTHPRRTEYTGLVYYIGRHPVDQNEGRDIACLAVLGNARPINMILEPEDTNGE